MHRWRNYFLYYLNNYDKKMQEEFILINKHLASYQRKMIFFFEFYQIIKLFFLLRVNLYRFYQVHNYYAIFVVEVGITSRKVESVCRESSSRIFAPSQYLMGSNTGWYSSPRTSNPRKLEKRISWLARFSVFHCSSTSYSYVRK